MKLQEPAALPNELVSGIALAPPRIRRSGPMAGFGNFISKTLIIAELDARKLRHDPSEILMRAVQPALWLLIFGEVFQRIRAIPTGGIPYLDYLAPGILAQSVLFISIFSGITIIWERDLGIIHKFLASPSPRAALVLGKALATGIKGLAQAFIIYVLAWLLGVQIRWNPLAIAGVALMVILASAAFSTFSLIVACLLKTRDRVMGIGQVMTMPLFFASNAIYPIAAMPDALKIVAQGNPLTYAVDGIREMMLARETITLSLGLDFAVLVVAMVILVTIGAKLYPNVVV